MPHIILEYSYTLRQKVDIKVLCEDMHNTLAQQGVDIGRIKTRAIALDDSVVGNPEDNKVMAHITLLLLEGRDIPTKRSYGDVLHKVLKAHIEPHYQNCAITLEVRDMVEETYFL